MTTPASVRTAGRAAQCGRTYQHLPHEVDTASGWCAGLDGTEVMRGETCTTPACTTDHPATARAGLPRAEA